MIKTVPIKEIHARERDILIGLKVVLEKLFCSNLYHCLKDNIIGSRYIGNTRDLLPFFLDVLYIHI